MQLRHWCGRVERGGRAPAWRRKPVEAQWAGTAMKHCYAIAQPIGEHEVHRKGCPNLPRIGIATIWACSGRAALKTDCGGQADQTADDSEAIAFARNAIGRACFAHSQNIDSAAQSAARYAQRTFVGLAWRKQPRCSAIMGDGCRRTLDDSSPSQNGLYLRRVRSLCIGPRISSRKALLNRLKDGVAKLRQEHGHGTCSHQSETASAPANLT